MKATTQYLLQSNGKTIKVTTKKPRLLMLEALIDSFSTLKFAQHQVV